MSKRIIDVCCGSKGFWFDKQNPDVVFCDKRFEPDLYLADKKGNGHHIHVVPDVICDFKHLPFENESFYMVVFDPPHLIDKKETSLMVKKYGTLPVEWKGELKQGFDECMRVLKPNGVLIFKWSEVQIKTSEVIKLFEYPPLFGHKSATKSGTHWIAYMKAESGEGK